VRRGRLRDLGISIGWLEPGPLNAITDVAGVLVGHTTLIWDEPRVARTGVTVVSPCGGDVWRKNLFAGWHRFNGYGEMTGVHLIDEVGLLNTPIALSNTHQVGTVRDALVQYAAQRGVPQAFLMPVAAETWDGALNDADAFHIRPEHVFDALDKAASGAVAEGSVGGGTGMRAHEFKAGIGTASRRIECGAETFTVGVLVQANYGRRVDLRIDGVPVGRHLCEGEKAAGADGSIIVIAATDAPLLPIQCRRLAQRATVGLARTGGIGRTGSGDLFLAFSTGNEIDVEAEALSGKPAAATAAVGAVRMLHNPYLSGLFEGVAEAVEEAILNSLTAADRMVGYNGTVAEALPLERVVEIMQDLRLSAP
jgi:D-aminopeptidase